MILSFQHGFIFFGMPKTGSTTLHFLLEQHGDIVFSRVKHGKHASCKGALLALDKLFDRYPYEGFIRFGVVRNPVALVSSWYRVWSDPALGDPAHPGHREWLNDMSFAEFVASLEAGRKIPTADEFYGMDDGGLGVDYLIRNDHMVEDMAALEALLPLRVAATLRETRLNTSKRRPAAAGMDPSLAERIRRLYARDVEIYEGAADRNRAFLQSGFQPNLFRDGVAWFKAQYPEYYRWSREDRRVIRARRMLPWLTAGTLGRVFSRFRRRRRWDEKIR